MKIALVTQSLELGGAEKNMLWLSKGLTQLHHEVTLYVLRDTHSYFDPPPWCRVEYLSKETTHQGKIVRAIRTMITLRAALQKDRPELVISFMDQTNLITLLATRALDIPCIISERVHPDYSSIQMLPTLLKIPAQVLRRLLYPRAQKIIMQTASAAQALPWLRKEQITIIPNGFQKQTVTWQGETSHHIVSVGRLSPQKRHDLLIRAMPHVREVIKDATLTIYGAGSEHTQLAALIHSLQAEAFVTLAGTTKDIAPILSSAGVFVLSSDYEGFPTALGEAMSIGMPVVSTDCPSGPRELIGSHDCGTLVPCGEVKLLAEAIVFYLTNPAIGKIHGGNAQRRIEDYYSEEFVTSLWNETILRCERLDAVVP
jgi:GalNAc-alpha-(1->4)-GalNAc-alpha-(1->3)-diNAcBac-PP-undecaprenol alpha-1,4-N-acetyl-D-galactosaminyltransferase